jgi:type II secretory pathway pseudopilin PulG
VSLLVIIGLAVLVIVLLAVVIGWVDARRQRRRTEELRPYVERESHLW